MRDARATRIMFLFLLFLLDIILIVIINSSAIQTVGKGFVIPRRRCDFELAGTSSWIFHFRLFFLLVICIGNIYIRYR